MAPKHDERGGGSGVAERARHLRERAMSKAIGSLEDDTPGVAHGSLNTPYRRRALFLLMMVLAIDFADRSVVGALAPDLKRHFHLNNTQIGLLVAAFSIVGGVMTIPIGMLTDRVNRTRLMSISVAFWTIAMVFTGLATSFTMLFVSRTFLGVVMATGGPTTASLTGDLFPPAVRGGVLGIIGAGELVGDGVGFILAGTLAAALSWRWVFWLLGISGAWLAISFWRLREPSRCGSLGRARQHGDQDGGPEAELVEDEVREQVREAGVEPNEDLVLTGNQTDMPIWEAVRYVLRVRTNVIVIVANSIGNFFFGGVRTFAIIFAVHQYGVSQSVADIALLLVGVGAFVGILAGGRIGDHLMRTGHINGRILVAAFSYPVAAAAILPALFLHQLYFAIPIFAVGGACLSAPGPALDAVRLDIIHPRLWGRAEGVRTVLRIGAEAIAPLVFGVLADHLGPGGNGGARYAFLVLLPTLVINGLLLLLARRTYASEVASVTESIEREAGDDEPAREAA